MCLYFYYFSQSVSFRAASWTINLIPNFGFIYFKKAGILRCMGVRLSSCQPFKILHKKISLIKKNCKTQFLSDQKLPKTLTWRNELRVKYCYFYLKAFNFHLNLIADYYHGLTCSERWLRTIAFIEERIKDNIFEKN